MLPAVLPIQALQSNSHNILAGPGNSGKNINITSNNICSGSGVNNHITNNSTNSSNNNDVGGGNVAGLVGSSSSSTAAAKNQLEQLNIMREALFSQDGWGCQHVNQDTNWEVPSSPEPTNKDTAGPPMWKPTINNGTDLWESNLRNGGQPPAQQVQKPSWGHTPTSNLGGTWGEDDDGADSSSVWTGSVSNTAVNSTVGVGVGTTGVSTGVGPVAGPQWGQSVVGVGIGAAGPNTGSGGGTSGINVVAAVGAASTAGVNTPGNVTGPAANVGTAGNGWGDPREIRNAGPLGGGPIDMRNVDPRDPMRQVTPGDPRDLRLIDPRDPIRGDPRGISGRLNGTSEMWGHHQQISHNQIPVMNKMVVNTSGNNVSVTPGSVAGIVPAGVASSVAGNVGSQWGAAGVVGPKDITKPVTGWEEPSPPPQRRNMTNYDDGTSLWGQQARVPGGGSHWKDMDTMNRSHLIRNQNPGANIVGGGVVGNGGVQVGNPNNPMAAVVGGPQTRLAAAVGPSGVGGQLKAESSSAGMWIHPGGNGRNPGNSWADDGGHNVGSGVNATTASGWVEDKPSVGLGQIAAGSATWNDSPAGGWNNKQGKISGAATAAGWSTASSAGGGSNDTNDLNADWGNHSAIVVGKPQQQKLPAGAGLNVAVGLNMDMIKQSKQYRILVENGFKKDDVERALINANMNIEEAAEMLRTNSSLGMDGWRRHDESLGSYVDHVNSAPGGGFPGRYPTSGAQPTMSFPPNNLLNNIGGTAVTGGSNNPNLAAIQVQKYLNQGPHNVVGPQTVNSPFGQGATNASTNVNVAANTNNQPSQQHLRNVAQQIQLAVHCGYLSNQILNQPMTPAALQLLNQLLNNIKHLQAAQQSLSRGNNQLAINVAIAKYKQQIQNLQNQINAQQAIYVKQQQQQQQQPQSIPQNIQQQHASAHLNNANSEYLRANDAIGSLPGNFSELNLNKPTAYQSTPNPQSRLNQWKLPVLDKDMTTDSTDFSRAPGATKQGLSTTNTNNMGPLGLQSDGTWSTGRNLGDGWPDSSIENENKDWTVAQPPAATTYTDLVQEFEPGKPWKGSQIKNIEDDPSITPGSVARSPLSINPTPKDADIFAPNTGKNSPTDLPPLSLSSSTWSFNPNQNFPSWSDNPQQCATSELWSTSLNKTSRGPPPGLSTNKTVSGVAVTNPSSVPGSANGWLTGRGAQNTNTTWASGNSSWNSNWLLLKNLSSQIDGPTLRTLCMQHGPLLCFHLYLNQGIALCKYATREEASKAQMTLNNCVLGNTTIFAESPNDSEVQNILLHLPQTNQTNSSNSAGTSTSGNGGGIGSSGSGGGNASGSTGGGGGPNIPGNGANTSSSGANTNVGNVTSNNTVANPGGAVGVSNANSNNNNSSAVNGVAVNTPGGGKNASICGNNTPGGSNTTQQPANVAGLTTVVGSNATWRQTTQNQTQQQQQQQNQTRPSGRETEFDMSQFVCSIVDD